MRMAIFAFFLFGQVCFSQGYLRVFNLCEGYKATLACPNNHVIKVIYANFGGPVPNTCAATNTADQTCKTYLSTEKVIDLCDNKTSCLLHASNSTYGANCNGKNKTLTVNFYCLEKPSEGSNVFYVLGEGCTTPYSESNCDASRCQMLINSIQKIATNFRGFHFATVNIGSLKIVEYKRFDTHQSGNAALMMQWIDGLPEGTFVMLCSMDDATYSMTSAAWLKLESIGMKNPHKSFRSSHALIGFKGSSGINITRVKTTGTGEFPAVVSLTIVNAPENVQAKLTGNENVEILWQHKIKSYSIITISYKTATDTNAVEQRVWVNAELNRTTIGPLTKDLINVISLSYGISNASHYYLTNLFHVIPNYVQPASLGCQPGIYKVILETNPSTDTFSYTSPYWENNQTLNELEGMNVAFIGDNIKTTGYLTSTFKRMCVGMRLQNTVDYRFIEISSPNEGKSFLQLMKDGANTNAGRAKWKLLLPQNKRFVLQENCNLEGFKKFIPTPFKKTRFGIVGNNENECISPDSYIGFGSTGGFMSWPKNENLKAHGYILSKTASIYDVFNGGWNNWSAWTPCPVTCGTGNRFRNRTCNNPFTANGGLPCIGDEKANKTCHFDCPPAPDNLRGTKGEQRLTLNWDLIPQASLSDIISPIQNYVIILKNEKGEISANRQLSSTATSVIIYSLQIYSRYCFTVHVLLASGVEGNKSTDHCLYTEESTPIAAPDNFIGFNTSSWCLNFTWTVIPTKLARGIIKGYYIYLRESGSDDMSTKYTTTAKNTSQICNLKPFTSYQASIEGFTKFGTGGSEARSSLITVRTDEHVPIRAPTITLVHNLTSTSLKVKWNKMDAIYWNGYPLGYKVYYTLKSSQNSSIDVIDINSWLTTSLNITDLEIYKEYNVWMAAYTSKGIGVNGTAVSASTDEDNPSRGPDAVWAHNSSAFTLSVHWKSLDPVYRLGILLGYRVFCKNLNTKDEKYIDVQANADIAVINDLRPFTNHSVKVSPFNIKGFGPNSSDAFAITDQYVPSRAPDNVNGYNLSSTTILLSWSPIQEQYHLGILLGYTILWRKTLEHNIDWNETKVDHHNHSAIVRHLAAYTNFTFRIAGFTSKGNGNFSTDIVIISGEDAPRKPPEKLSIIVNSSSSLSITWSPPSSGVPGIIRGYKVSYKPIYTEDDFKSHLLVRKSRKKRAIISTPLQLNEINMTVGPNVHLLVLNGLHGNTNYSIKILAFTIFDGLWSKIIYIKTPEAIPGMSPMNVTATAKSYHSVIVTWKHVPPAYAHGFIDGYIVFYQQGNHSNVTSFNESQIPEKTYLEITHLEFFQWYSFQVLAFTSVGIGVKSEVVHVRTKEWIPIKAPEGLNATSYYSPFQINVTWHPLPYAFWKGHPLNYQLTFYEIAIGGEKVRPSQIRKYTFLNHFSKTTFYFDKAEPFTKYGIEIRALTAIGAGPSSIRIFAETCNVDRDVFHTSWMSKAAFASTGASNAISKGIIPSLLQSALHQCNGHCETLKNEMKINFQIDGTGSPALKSSYKELRYKLNTLNDFTFPIIKQQFQGDEYQYIHLLNIPGAAFIKQKPTSKIVGKNILTSTKTIAGEIFIFVLFCWLFGVLLWLLETWMKTKTFDSTVLRGSFEGFYWAYTTATTVGYGDKYPSSIPGRLLMIIWAFVGLILLALLSGVLTNLLVAKEEVIPTSLGGSQKKPTAGIGAVTDSWEYYASIKKSFEIDKEYISASDLIEGVAKGEIEYGILDLYITTAYQAKMEKLDVTIKKILNLQGNIGLYTSGHARKLRYCIEKYVEENSQYVARVLTKNIKETGNQVSSDVKKAEADSLLESKKPEFYSWESTLMRFYIKLSSLLLGILFIIGCIYELIKFIWKQKKSIKIEPSQNAENIQLFKFKGFSFDTDEQQTSELARRRWKILKEIMFDSTHEVKHIIQLGIDDISHLRIKQKKWLRLKEETCGKNYDFIPILIKECQWSKHLESIKSLDNEGKQGRNVLRRFYSRIMRNIQISLMNMPNELERETDQSIQDFRHRIEHKLNELEAKHLRVLLDKKEQIFKKYGKYKYIKENELIEPY